jgi:transcriptional regulator with XRE-family HTH domain
MSKISSGINDLDRLIDSLYIGDNVVWEVDAGTSYDIFIKNFIIRSIYDLQKVIYVSFNRSPHSILYELDSFLIPEHFILIDCFTSGKGKNDNTFLRFYESSKNINVVRITNPKNIDEFTSALNSIEDSLSPGARYVFDSLTGMQDLWEDENDTYKFFTYMCPRLYDLDTVAYWILEKDAHSQKFKANIRHITQVVFDVYKRRENLYIKALKLTGRHNRDAFKPHLYEVADTGVVITLPKKEPVTDIGTKIKELRMARGMSQKDLADKVELTPSFISQLENNQISPSLGSFLQICNALGVRPGGFLEEKTSDIKQWLFKKEAVVSVPTNVEDGVKMYRIVSEEKLSAMLILFPAHRALSRHFFYRRTPEFIHVLKGDLSITFDGRTERLSSGDSLYLKESFPSGWKNEGGDEAEILVIWQ